MKKKYLFLLCVISYLYGAHAGLTIDTSSQKSFTPLRVGNEWVYHDSSYTSNGALTIISIDRIVKLEKHVISSEKDFWLASIAKKGTFGLFVAGHDGTDTIDTAYIDTLRILPDNSFSFGMIKLFPWLTCDTADTLVHCTFRNLNDTSVMNLNGSSYSIGGVSATIYSITALSSIGMVNSKTESVDRLSNSMQTSILKRFNGIAVKADGLTAVRKPLDMHVPLSSVKHLRRMCTLTGQLRMNRGESYFSIQGKALSRRLPISPGIIIAK
jgi:hypothetical protein